MTMLRLARDQDAAFITEVWTRAENAMFLPPPDPGEVAEHIALGHAFLWTAPDRPLGFATINLWDPGNYGISVIAMDRPGNGAGREFLSALVDHLFADPGTNRVGLDTAADNHRAMAVFARLGFVAEGMFRECWRRPDGLWVDCPHFSILRREWLARQG